MGGTAARKGEIHFCFRLDGGYLVGVLGVWGCVQIMLLGRLGNGEAEKGWSGGTDHHVTWLVVGS